jgi:shikimate 5-dehydrogenase
MGELLRDKTAVIDGAGGATGAASQEFAREGARVFLTGGTLAKVVAVAKAIPPAPDARRSGRPSLRSWRRIEPGS